MISGFRFIESYVHGGRVGVLIEVSFRSSFTVGVPEFKRLASDLALQVAGAGPASVQDLVAQRFVKDDSVTVGEIIERVSAQLGESISVTRFVRWDTDQPQSSPPPSTTPAAALRQRSTP